jgi:subtilisin family serine protease
MDKMKRIACVLAVLALCLSVATVVVSMPITSAGDSIALDKLEPKLKNELPSLLKSSPDAKLRTIVFLADGADLAQAEGAIAMDGAEITAQYPALGAVATSVPAKSVGRLAAAVSVEKILLDERRYTVPTPMGDWLTDYETIFNKTTGIWYASTPYTMGADKVWEKGITGEGVRVAVLDTGVDLYQNDIAPAIYDYRSFTSEDFHDFYGHGTSTASLIASRAVNTYYGFIKLQGMAPGSMIMAGKVLADDGYGWDSWIIAGIEWAVAGSDGDPSTNDGAQIISMSLGGLEVPNDGNDPTALALDRAAAYGVSSFVAAGNEGMGRGTVGSPGVSKSAITVGATTNNAEAYYLLGYWPFTKSNGRYLANDYENNHMIWWSSRGPSADGRIDPDLAAVGAWGPAAAPGNTLELQFGGTSMATPVAAGIGALVYETFMKTNGRAPTPAEMKAIMMGTAMDVGYGPLEQGAGRVDALAAYEAAVGTRQVGAVPSVAISLVPGQTKAINLGPGKIVGSKVFEKVPNEGFLVSGSVRINKDWFYSFQIPEGVSFAHFDLAFDQVYVYGTNVHDFYGTGFTDDHLNLVLYRVEASGRTMVNYAYMHSNTQELNARVTPGSYELRVWGAQYVNKLIPFSLMGEFFRTASWSWVSGSGPVASFKAPIDAQAGTHVGFVMVARGADTSLVPVAITVPMAVGVPVKGAIDVGHETYSSMEGDWVYYALSVPSGSEAVTAVLSWTDWNTDIDLYLIDPARNVVAASMTPYLGGGLYGPWATSTGTTAQVVSVPSPAPGRWMIGIHDTFLGKLFVEPYVLVASLSSPVGFGVPSATVSGSTAVKLSNQLQYPVSVALSPVMNQVVYTTETHQGTVTSANIGGTGYDEILFSVAPGTKSVEISIQWDNPGADIDVVIYATDGSDRGILWNSGDKLLIENPVPGVWEAAVALKNTDQSTPYTLTVTTGARPAWTDLKLSASEVMLGPGASQTVTLTSATTAPGTYYGSVLAYDAYTGCVYDELAVTVVVE